MANSTKKNAEGLDQKHLINWQQRIANMSLYKAVLAIGSGSAAKVLITTGATGVYMIEGKQYVSPASQEVAFTATTDDIAPDADTAQEKTYLVMIDSAGTGSILGGDQADIGESLAPEPPATKCVLGKVVLSIAAGTTKFDASTDLLSASHITDTYTDLGFLVH
jgi:hypothetical protein